MCEGACASVTLLAPDPLLPPLLSARACVLVRKCTHVRARARARECARVCARIRVRVRVRA